MFIEVSQCLKIFDKFNRSFLVKSVFTRKMHTKNFVRIKLRKKKKKKGLTYLSPFYMKSWLCTRRKKKERPYSDRELQVTHCELKALAR